jgi:hypothetical protein
VGDDADAVGVDLDLEGGVPGLDAAAGDLDAAGVDLNPAGVDLEGAVPGLDAATGALDPNVDPVVGDASKFVKALLAVGPRVYVGGGFNTVDGALRPRLAAFDANGVLDTRWKPRTNNIVSALSPACDGTTIFAGGKFRTAAGTNTPLVSRETVARFDLATGALHPWQITPGSTTTDMHALDLGVTCGRVFVGYGGPNRAWAYDVADAPPAGVTYPPVWKLQGNGDFQTVAVYGERVLFGGHFTSVSGAGQSTTTRTRFAAVDFNGRLDPWAPTFEGNYFGPWDILADSAARQVWVGGNFSTVSGVSQRSIARFTDR